DVHEGDDAPVRHHLLAGAVVARSEHQLPDRSGRRLRAQLAAAHTIGREPWAPSRLHRGVCREDADVGLEVRDQLLAMSEGNRLRAAVHAELAEDPRDVGGDRLLADHQLARDRPLIEPCRKEVQNLSLAWRESEPLGTRLLVTVSYAVSVGLRAGAR